MPKKTLIDAVEAATDALLDVAILSPDDEALRTEALAAFDRYTALAEQLQQKAVVDAAVIERTLANARAL